MNRLRCMVARWLRRQADRLDPPPQITVRLTADSEIFKAAVADVEERLRTSQQTPKRGHGSDTTVPSAHVPPPRDSGATRRQRYAGYVGPDVTPSESGVAVTFTDSLPRRQDR